MATVVVAGAFTTDDATGARAKFGCGMNADASETLTMSARRARRTFPPTLTGMDEENKRNFLLGRIGARVASALQAVGESLAGEQRLGDAPA